MKKQYDKILDLVPNEYSYTKSFTITNNKTHEKVGEGIGYFTKPEPDDGDKLNQITIGYEFDFKMVWDEEKSEYYRTNEIESYTIKISLDDLRQTKLTRQGY
tara:strand:- start:183 stop:488 length:306 start_codon:yes stop_codon:yes gene_type:complete